MNTTDLAIQNVTYPQANYFQEVLSWAITYIQTKPKGWMFYSDQLRDAYRQHDDIHTPAEPRVWGAVIRHLRQTHTITLHTTKIIKPTYAHHRMTNIWKKC